jgi:hypothetical protein
MSTDQEVQNTVEDGYFVTTDIQNKDLFSVDEKIADKENCDNDILSAVKKSVCSKLDVYVDANYAKILYSDGVYDLYDNSGYVCQVYLTAEEEALFQSVISTMNVLEDGIAGPYDFDDESISSALEVSDELDAKVKTFTNQKNQ